MRFFRRLLNKPSCVVQCTPKEFVLLDVLIERSGRLQTREQLLSDVWGGDYEIGPRAIDRHVCCLRAGDDYVASGQSQRAEALHRDE